MQTAERDSDWICRRGLIIWESHYQFELASGSGGVLEILAYVAGSVSPRPYSSGCLNSRDP